MPDKTVFEPTVVAVPDVDFEEEDDDDDDDEDDEEDEVEAPIPEPDRDDNVRGAMLPGPGVGDRRVQDPGRSAPIQGTRCRSRQQSSRLLIPVIPVMLMGALLRIRCCHAGTSCGRHCPGIVRGRKDGGNHNGVGGEHTTDLIRSVLKMGNVRLAPAVGALVEIAPAGGDEFKVATAVFSLWDVNGDTHET